MSGAFGGKALLPKTPPQDSPQEALGAFKSQLSQVSGKTSAPGNPAPPVLAAPGAHVTDPQSVRSNALSAIDRLTSMVKGKSRMGGQEAPGGKPILPPRGTFVAGVKPTPTGPTAHEVMTLPEHQATLKNVIADHEQQNPGRALKAPALMSLWNARHKDNPKAHLNEARARSVVAKVKSAQQSYVQKQVQQYMRQGAKKAVT